MTSTRKVLIIEDEVLIAKDLSYILEDIGYENVGIASTGAKALELFRNHKVDLVISDININGDMDGIDTVKAILEFKEVPIIYISAFSDTKTVQRAIETSPSSFLTKPYNERSVQIAIDLAMANFNKTQQNLENNEVFQQLTQREREIILLIAEGKTSAEIADQLFISPTTAAKHRNNILAKTGCNNTSEVIKLLYS
ncbi:response regulator transcription factor [Echinicola sp. CAU 1574]|uniref:Response regulator transcription factor n=1 Tax=Echinicola arenosa TaxID=2774144 RepID=A0ABR9AHG3_9BACT|nr:response regulator transcription factor [Echinicola arenosa]MBD8488197.1 response regulator transcription factor [Echinicola arenosa]